MNFKDFLALHFPTSLFFIGNLKIYKGKYIQAEHFGSPPLDQVATFDAPLYTHIDMTYVRHLCWLTSDSCQ